MSGVGAAQRRRDLLRQMFEALNQESRYSAVGGGAGVAGSHKSHRSHLTSKNNARMYLRMVQRVKHALNTIEDLDVCVYWPNAAKPFVPRRHETTCRMSGRSSPYDLGTAHDCTLRCLSGQMGGWGG